MSWRSLPAQGKSGLDDKSPVSPAVAFSVMFLEGLAGAPVLLTRLGRLVCCGHSWLRLWDWFGI